MTLTIREIKDLCKFAGLRLSEDSDRDTDQDETEIQVCNIPKLGLWDEGVKEYIHYKHIAYFNEYPEEGAFGLGKEVTS